MKKAGVVPLIVCLSMSCILFLLWQRDPSISRENHFMENVQASCFLLALIFILRRPLRERAWNLPFGFLFLAFLTILLREVDLRPFPLPRFVILLSSKGRNVALAFGWALFIYSFVRNVKASLKDFVALGRRAAGGYFLLGCLLYGLAWPFDQVVFGMTKDTSLFIEEVMENMGTLSFAFSALFFSRDKLPLPSEKTDVTGRTSGPSSSPSA